MVKRETETGNVPQVDSRLIKDAFHLSVALLGNKGNLRERDGQTEVVATDDNGFEISIASPFNQEHLQILSRVGGRDIKDIILGEPSRIRVSKGEAPMETDVFTLVKFDPGQLRTIPEEAWKLEELVRQGVQYSIEGQGTPEILAAKVNQLIAGSHKVSA